MIYKIAQFKVKKDAVKRCKGAIAQFVDAVKKEKGTVIYQSFQLPDHVSFIHFMAFQDQASEEFHSSTKHVSAFTKILYPCCEEKPVFTDLTNVSSA